MNRSKEISDLKAKLKVLEKEEELFRSLPTEHQLAEILHEKLCHYNHTDSCGWFYEKWDNPGYSKKDWLNKAKSILKIESDVEKIEKIISALK